MRQNQDNNQDERSIYFVFDH